MKFKVLRGKHAQKEKTPKGQPAVKIYEAGEVVESDKNLAKIFVNKFELIGKETSTKKKAAASSEPKNVTADFPTAVEAGLEVYKVGNKWNVLDPDDSTEVATQVKKAEIEPAIEAFLAGE